KRALVDFLGVAVGASGDAPVRPVRATIKRWNSNGNARIFIGGQTTPALAALANGTMAHAMDYDDTHPGGAGHPSACCWSSTLALAEHHGFEERDAMAAFLTGYEVMAKLGGGYMMGVGRSLQRRGLHPTSVVGRAGAAAAACVLLKLNQQQIGYALGVAATTAGGLVGSFGTHGKPFHAGKAAMDGILAAQLASDGFVAATHLYELGELDKTPRKKEAHRATLLDVFIQNHDVEPLPLDFEQSWEILTNGFKPYASCRATQASTQAARTLATQIAGRAIKRVHAKVHPNALITAGKLAPLTPLEGKFSVPFCIALALRGHKVVASDFTDGKMHDASVMDVVPVVELEAVDGQAPHSAHLDVYLANGEHLHADTDIVIGHPDNPMSWDDLRVKFEGLVEPVIGAQKAKTLFETARDFEAPGSIRKISELLAEKQ
ncbi:MAG TPA: MmgE/PrpD family protein, partial [Burkholderiales bacterium]|nr:MmgE/PrpD family protein [Burkholderiales bacterium]